MVQKRGYKGLYQAKLLTRSGIQARSLPLSRSNLASYDYEYLWSFEVLLLDGGLNAGRCLNRGSMGGLI
jgi:hypothetical protein